MLIEGEQTRVICCLGYRNRENLCLKPREAYVENGIYQRRLFTTTRQLQARTTGFTISAVVRAATLRSSYQTLCFTYVEVFGRVIPSLASYELQTPP